MESLLAIGVIVGLVWFWSDSLRAREFALRECKTVCERTDRQLLDQTVALASVGLTRDPGYLDAFVPENGKTVIDYIPQPERRAAMAKSGRETGYVAPIPLKAFGVTREEDLAWANPRIIRQPFGTFEQPIRLAQPAVNGLPRAFIACTNPASGSFDQFAEVIQKDRSWKFYDLPTGHDVMITAPQELVRLLRELA